MKITILNAHVYFVSNSEKRNQKSLTNELQFRVFNKALLGFFLLDYLKYAFILPEKLT